MIDFQLAATHRRRGRIFRLMAREDLRHLLKQKRAYAPQLLTPAERRMLARKSLPAHLWMTTGKRLYNLVTRRLMNWSDGEGTGDRIERDGSAIRAALLAHPRVTGVALCTYALPARGTGLYVFAETDLPAARLAALVPAPKPELLQPVMALPRHADGSPRLDALQLVATNRLDDLAELEAHEPDLAKALRPIVSGRLNLTDRMLKT